MFTPEKVNLDVKDLKYEFINGKLQERKSFDANGHDYVDLGLPSGTLWATCNVGASNPSDSGLFFQWGDTKGYTKEQVGTGDGKKKFASNWSDYKWRLSGSTLDDVAFTKYTIPGAVLELEDDAAHVHMGGDWHIPTPEQIKELLKYTTRRISKINRYDIKGVSFISKTNPSKSIFFPATGDAQDGSARYSRRYGRVWSCVLRLSKGYVTYGQDLEFSSGRVDLDYNTRFRGLSVRGVLAEN